MWADNEKIKDKVVRKAVAVAITFILIFTVIIPTINSQYISVKENIDEKELNFKPINSFLEEYTLTIEIVGNGTVYKDPDQTSYPYGTVVNLTATACCPWWVFDHWEGDVTGTQNPTNITMNGNKTVTAVFIQIEYNLTITIVGQGTVTKVPDQPTYHFGDVVTLTAIPDEDWLFSHWSGDLTGSNNPENITIDEPTDITANFISNEYSITINIYGEGSVVKNPDNPTYTYGTIVELTAVAGSGWIFDYWSGDVSGTANPKEILIDGNKVVNAYFKEEGGDTTPPTVEITKPTKGLYFKDIKLFPFLFSTILNSVTIEAQATDNDSGVEKVEFYIDGNLKDTDTASPYQYFWNGSSPGMLHNVEVKAYDNAGNSATSELNVIRIMTKYPGLIILLILILIVLAYLRED